MSPMSLYHRTCPVYGGTKSGGLLNCPDIRRTGNDS